MPPEAQPYVDAIADNLIAGGDFMADPTAARCIAESTVAALGPEEVLASGVTPELFVETGPMSGLSAAQAEAIGAAMVDCLDDPVGVFAEVIAEGAGPETVACLEDELEVAELRRFMVLMLGSLGDDEPPEEMLDFFIDLGDRCPGAA